MAQRSGHGEAAAGVRHALGVRSDHFTLLTDKKATRKAILKALKSLARRAFQEDLVFIFIATHGLPNDDNTDIKTYEMMVWLLGHTAKTLPRPRSRRGPTEGDASRSPGLTPRATTLRPGRAGASR